MSIEEKIRMMVEGELIEGPSECFAVPGSNSIVDVINPRTGRTAIYGKTLEDVRAEKGYEQAERMTIEEFCRDKAARQDAPVEWIETTEEKYDEMLNCLPPARYASNGFLVGEPWDHHAMTGRPRYAAFLRKGDKYYKSNRPMTTKEFDALSGNPPSALDLIQGEGGCTE